MPTHWNPAASRRLRPDQPRAPCHLLLRENIIGNLVQADVHTVKFRDSLADCRRKLRTMMSYAINR